MEIVLHFDIFENNLREEIAGWIAASSSHKACLCTMPLCAVHLPASFGRQLFAHFRSSNYTLCAIFGL
jgi:hypothetical protein